MKVYKSKKEAKKDVVNGELLVDDDVSFEFNLKCEWHIIARNIIARNIRAHKIDAFDIIAHDIMALEIKAYNIEYYGYMKFKNVSIKVRIDK